MCTPPLVRRLRRQRRNWDLDRHHRPLRGHRLRLELSKQWVSSCSTTVLTRANAAEHHTLVHAGAGRAVVFPAGEALVNAGARAGGHAARADAAADGLQRAVVDADVVVAVLDILSWATRRSKLHAAPSAQPKPGWPGRCPRPACHRARCRTTPSWAAPWPPPTASSSPSLIHAPRPKHAVARDEGVEAEGLGREDDRRRWSCRPRSLPRPSRCSRRPCIQ